MQNFENISSVHMELQYDPLLLQAVNVERGASTRESTLAYSFDTTGKVIIGIMDKQGINGSGTLAMITFQSTSDSSLPSRLMLENVIANSAETGRQISVDIMNGTFIPADRSVSKPSVISLQMLAR